MDESKITKQAKNIMNRFISALEKTGKNDAVFIVEREKNVRGTVVTENDSGFAERMFDNAQKVKDGCIVAEKKKW